MASFLLQSFGSASLFAVAFPSYMLKVARNLGLRAAVFCSMGEILPLGWFRDISVVMVTGY